MLELKNLSFSVNDGNKTKQILKDINLVIDDKKFTETGAFLCSDFQGNESALCRVWCGDLWRSGGNFWTWTGREGLRGEAGGTAVSDSGDRDCKG